MALYRTYSDYLKEKYNEKVYKIPIALPVTCPNRDGTLAVSYTHLTLPTIYSV